MSIWDVVKDHAADVVDEIKMIDPQGPKIIRKPGSRTEENFGGLKFLSRTEVQRKIQEAAKAQGKEIDAAGLNAAYAEVLRRNQAARAEGRDVPEIVDIEDEAIDTVLSPLEAGPVEFANAATLGLPRRLGIMDEATAGDPASMFAGALGGIRGIMTAAGPLQGAMAKAMGATAPGVSAGGRLARNVASGLAAGGAYGAGSAAVGGGDITDEAWKTAAMFGGIGLLGGGIPYLAGKAGAQYGALAEGVMSSRPGRFAFDAPVFYGLDRMEVKDGEEGSEWYSRAARTLGGALGAQVGGRRRMTPNDLRDAVAKAERARAERELLDQSMREAEAAREAQAAVDAAGRIEPSAGPEPISTEPAPEPVKVRRKDLRPPKEYDRRGMPAIEGEVPAPALTKADAKRVKELLLEPTPEPAPEPAPEPPIYPMFPEAARVESILPQRMLPPEPVPSPGGPRQTVSEGPLDPLTRTAPQTLPDVEPAGVRRPYMTKADATREGKVAARLMVDTPPPKDTGRPMPQMSQADAKNMPEKIASAGTSDFTLDMLGLQSTYEAVAKVIRERAERKMADLGGRTPEQARATSPQWLEIGEVMNAIERKELSPKQAAEWMLKNQDKLPGAVTPEGRRRAKAELEAEGVKNITEKKIEKRARANSTPAEVQGSLTSGMNRVDAEIAQFLDPLTATQTMEKNQSRGPLVESGVILGHSSERAQIVMSQEYVRQVRDVLENPLGDGSPGVARGTKDATVVFEVLDGNAGAIKGAENPAAVTAAVGRLKPILREMWETRDMVDRAYGGKGVGKIESYAPHDEKRYRMRENPNRWLQQMLRPREAGSETPGAPTKVLSNRERQRYGRSDPSWRERDIWNVMDRYIADQSGRVARTPVVASAEASVAFMKRLEKAKLAEATEASKRGETDAAEQMRKDAKIYRANARAYQRIMQSAYNGVPYGLNKTINDLMFRALPGTRIAPGAPVYQGSRWMKQRFNEARYVAAFPFIALRMWTSGGLMGSYPGQLSSGMVEGFLKNIPQWNAETMVEMWTPRAQELVDATHFGWRKRQQLGGMRAEGSTKQASQGTGLIRPGKYQRTMDFLSKPTNAMENMTSRYSVLMADKIGRYMGLEGRELEAVRNDMIMKTQSAYHSEAMPEIRKNPVINTAFPAQSFSLTSLSNVLESAIPGFGVDYHGQAERVSGVDRYTAGARGVAGAVAGMYLTNMLYEWANTYRDVTDPDQLESFTDEAMANTIQAFIPWSTAITGAGPGKGQMYPAALFQDLFGGPDKHKGIKQLVDAGEWERAGAIFAKHFLPAGGQMNRALTADFMIDRGILTEDDRGLAAVVGWWATPNGKAYLRQLSGLPSGASAPRSAPRPGATDSGMDMGMDTGVDMGMDMGGN